RAVGVAAGDEPRRPPVRGTCQPGLTMPRAASPRPPSVDTITSDPAFVYALHALQYLAARGGETPVPSHHIARARGLSGPSLLKALTLWVSAGVLRWVEGPNGGYRLARPAAKITLLEVVEAVGGPICGQAPRSQEAGWDGGGLDARLEAVCDQVATKL